MVRTRGSFDRRTPRLHGWEAQVINFVTAIRPEDLELVQTLLEDRKITPVIDRTYSLSETAEAIRYLEAGHARGKVVVRLP
jgi:NADPH:quinone reductase-like Zn-dependent oxidoreductase